MGTLYNTTRYLFDCDFFADDFDANDTYEHYDCAQKQMEENKWSDVYNSWFEYLLKNGNTPEKVINFVNLFLYYGGQDQAIKNPYYSPLKDPQIISAIQKWRKQLNEQ